MRATLPRLLGDVVLEVDLVEEVDVEVHVDLVEEVWMAVRGSYVFIFGIALAFDPGRVGYYDVALNGLRKFCFACSLIGCPNGDGFECSRPC